MRLERLTLRELRMNLVTPFQTSVETTTTRRILLTEAIVDGVTGWGECVAGEGPSYSPETTDTAWLITRDYLWPLLKGKQFASAAEVSDMLAGVRGHNMARWAVEADIWESEGKQNAVSLPQRVDGVRRESSS